MIFCQNQKHLVELLTAPVTNKGHDIFLMTSDSVTLRSLACDGDSLNLNIIITAVLELAVLARFARSVQGDILLILQLL